MWGSLREGGGGKDNLHVHVIKLTFHSIMDRDIQEVAEAAEY